MYKILLLTAVFYFSLLITAQSTQERLENSPRHQEWVTVSYEECAGFPGIS